MNQCERGFDIRVGDVGINLVELLPREHPFVYEGSGGETGEVKEISL